MTTTLQLSRLVLVAVVIAAGGCSFDIANPNTPDVIGENPSRSVVAATANGILIATRADVADFALKAGILRARQLLCHAKQQRLRRHGDAEQHQQHGIKSRRQCGYAEQFR